MSLLGEKYRYTFLLNKTITNGSNAYVIYVKNRNELAAILGELKKIPSWNSHAKFMVVSKVTAENPHQVAVLYFKELWQVNAIDSILLIGVENVSDYFLFSGNPFRRIAIRSDICSLGRFENHIKLFDKMLMRCINNCQLRVHYVNAPPSVMNGERGMLRSNYFVNQGFDMNLLNIIAIHLNLTLQHTKVDGNWGYIYENGTIDGNLALLSNDSVDILIGSYLRTSERNAYFDTSDSHIEQYMVWCVGHDQILVGFKNMTNIFSYKLWILIIFMYVSISICIWILGIHQRREFASYKTLSDILLITVAIVLGVGTDPLPKTTIVRYFVAMLTLLGFNITLIYSGYLTGIVAAPKYVEKINSISDIYKYNLTTYFLRTDTWILGEDKINEIPMKVISEKWKNCPTINWCFENIAGKKAYSYFTNSLRQNYVIATKGYPIRCIRHNTIPLQLTFVMKRGFPFLRQFNRIINRVIEGGFVFKWKQDLLKHRPIHVTSNDSNIKFENLLPIFIFLLVSHVVSFIAFISEILFYKYKTSNGMLRPSSNNYVIE